MSGHPEGLLCRSTTGVHRSRPWTFSFFRLHFNSDPLGRANTPFNVFLLFFFCFSHTDFSHRLNKTFRDDGAAMISTALASVRYFRAGVLHVCENQWCPDYVTRRYKTYLGDYGTFPLPQQCKTNVSVMLGGKRKKKDTRSFSSFDLSPPPPGVRVRKKKNTERYYYRIK